MAARRCSLCGINYPVLPVYKSVTLCPIHDEEMPYDQSLEPDEDWQEKMAAVSEAYDLTIEDAELVPDIDADAMFVKDGRLFVFSWDVIERGISHRLPDGTLLRIGQKVYEVIGYIDAMRAYWVGSFRMYLTDKDVRDLGNPNSKRRKRTA